MTTDHSTAPSGVDPRTQDGSEPPAQGIGLTHEHDRSLSITHGGAELARYVYRPWDAQLESPRPYFHPIRTLNGDLVSLYRPHDHVWHKGIAWSLPNVGPANFWGGTTYLRDHGYQQLDNDGAMVHRAFDRAETFQGAAVVRERLDWVTEQGETWFSESRGFQATADPDRGTWTLVFTSSFTNLTDRTIPIGSPTTEGRPNAGYGGLFWRGPRSFSGGRVYTPDTEGGDDLMGERAPWMAYAGRHDEHDRSSTLVFVDAPDNQGHPTEWFVRTGIYACVCPAPFFSEEVPVEPGAGSSYSYAVVIADGDRGRQGSARLAEAGRTEFELAEKRWAVGAS